MKQSSKLFVKIQILGRWS